MAGDAVDHRDVHKKVANDTHSKEHDHTTAMQNEVLHYKPPILNHARYGAATEQPIDRSKCSTGPKLNELTIDLGIHEKDTPRNGDSYAEREAAKKRDLPISNEHFRDIAKEGAERLAQGTFSLQLRNALDEAFKSDNVQKDHGKHVEDLLKYVNSQLCGSDTTLGREGNMIKVIQTQYNNAKPEVGYYNLETKNWKK